MRFQDAAPAARHVVYAGIQADQLVARVARLLEDATSGQRLMARAVMNGERTDPAVWRAMFPTLFGPRGIGAGTGSPVEANAERSEALLVAWVNECLYVHEIEGFVVRRVDVVMCADVVVVGTLHGEPIDPRRHRLGTVVNGATIHEARVGARPGRHEVSLIVDV